MRVWRNQIAVVAVAAAVAVALILSRSTSATAEAPVPQFDMLAFLDTRVAAQEDARDVRCWSSFNKLQMFITQCEISEEAKVVRIEQHMRLIDSLWDESRARSERDGMIDAAAVSAVLAARFPAVDTSDDFLLRVGSGDASAIGMADSLKDYSDTIEPWRLLQTWAVHQTDAEGRFAKQPPFDEEALLVLYRFLRTYDLAVLRQARDIAFDKKSAVIDKASLTAAFKPGERPAP